MSLHIKKTKTSRIIMFFLLLLLGAGKMATAQISGPTYACAGGSASYYCEYSALAYTWKISGGTITSGASSRTVNVVWTNGDGVIEVTTRTNIAELNTYSKRVSAHRGGYVQASGNWCSPASGTLTLTTNTSGVVRWESSPDGVNWSFYSSNTATSLPFSNITRNTVFRAVSYACGTYYYSGTATVNVIAPPAAPSVSPGSRCGNGGVTLYASGGTNYRWYNSGGTLLQQGATSYYNTPILGATTTYYVSSVSSQGCESTRVPVTATINPVPADPPAPSVTAQCGSSVLTAAAPPAGFTYYWQNTADEFSTANSSSTRTVTTSGYHYIRSRNNSTGCWSQATAVHLLITNDPGAPPVPTVRDDCGKATLTAAAPTWGLTYYWQTTASGTSTANSSQTYTATTPGTYYLRARNNDVGCWSPATAVNVGITPRLSCLDGQNLNFIVTNTIRKEGVRTEAEIPLLLVSDNTQTISYVDGFGRPMQNISVQGSPTRQDIVQIIGYDRAGRENKKYMPYTVSGEGRFQSNATTALTGFFSAATDRPTTGKPWAETVFEASNLNKIKEQGAPGEPWQPVTGKTVKTITRPNTGMDARMWTYDFATGQCSSPAYYAAGELMAEEITDEQGNKTLKFTDKLGRLVLVKKEISSAVAAQTYYVYDAFSRLRMVVQPMAVDVMTSTGNWTPNSDMISKWCFTYKYDKQGRVTEKRVPGSGIVYIVYNKRHQPILTQDAVQRKRNEWSFVKYDALNRVVMSGIYTHPSSAMQITMQQSADAHEGQFESRTAANYSTQFGYTIAQSFPVLNASNSTINMVNYFDDYDFDSNTATTEASFRTGELATETPSTETATRPTGIRVRVLNSNNMLLSVMFYDKWGRMIQQQQANHMGGSDVETNRYDFGGNILETVRRHEVDGTATTVKKQYEYDHAGRSVSLKHQVNAGPVVTLAAYRYNELGQQVEKKLHSTDNTNFLQKVDYRYNIRGWLTHVNDAALSESSDLFGMELRYNEGALSQPGLAYLNGHIAEIVVNDRIDNKQKAYTYSYDRMGRLNAASFMARSATGWNDLAGGFNEEGIVYDLNGNIKNLQRYAVFNGQSTRQKIDQLTYTYAGNKLVSVDDDPALTGGFTDIRPATGIDFSYDENGNMIADMNKGIDSIRYNHMNLVDKVSGSRGQLLYSYDAAGVKLSKTITEGSNGTTVRNYTGGFEYNGRQLDFIITEEGRVTKQSGGFNYEYNLTDNLGNVRVSFDRDPGTGQARIIQKNGYYPFGYTQPGSSFVSGQEGKYLYNGKELQEELGLNLYDYGARMYDPVLGRWNGVDAAAEKFQDWSPYNYALNSPVITIDPDGREAIVVSGGELNHGRFKFNFIEPAIHQIKQLKSAGETNITWTVMTAGYSADQLRQFSQSATELGVNFRELRSAKEFTSYINSKALAPAAANEEDVLKPRRQADPVTSVDVFGHGLVGEAAFAYGQPVSADFSWGKDEAAKLKPGAFSSGAVINFYTCNAATPVEGSNSLADVVNSSTNATVTGYIGKTDYKPMNNGEDWGDKANRWKNDYNTNGSRHLPSAGTYGTTPSQRVVLPGKATEPRQQQQEQLRLELR